MERGIACIKGGSHRVDIEVDGHLLIADMSARHGDSGAAPSEYELLLASLGACTAFTLGRFAVSQQWPLESIDVYMTLVREPGGMHIERMLFVTGIDRACQEVLLELARNTPLTLLLKAGLPISTILI